MEYQNVLVLTDFSKDSNEAVKAAIDFAKKYNSRLTVLNVVRDIPNLTFVLSDSEYHRLERKLEVHAEEQFDKMETAIPEIAEIEYKRKIRKGTPYISCLYEIENGNYDLVFAGSHGQFGFKKGCHGEYGGEGIAPFSDICIRYPEVVSRIRDANEWGFAAVL